ncbi:MAG: CDP-glucose 4,6-dehydratase, partial [Pseudomonadota bacterium]|nr:CDP-glucose 4,6-dehydratase [Pseudomonadota bacterium]
MESLVIDPSFWQGKSVLVTGHTGFKGSWLSLWLNELGANVTGYALAPATNPSM